ncbi:uncharacterized protein G2W53_043689 [Senna tora]|uniref:Uncharacterized protein n=1 Tax=Senna tora TaxID=362788 RepID=A0A834SI52_9FABA|nr:uncharacterized protein G2W53_043689 [Senna tora]
MLDATPSFSKERSGEEKHYPLELDKPVSRKLEIQFDSGQQPLIHKSTTTKWNFLSLWEHKTLN